MKSRFGTPGNTKIDERACSEGEQVTSEHENCLVKAFSLLQAPIREELCCSFCGMLNLELHSAYLWVWCGFRSGDEWLTVTLCGAVWRMDLRCNCLWRPGDRWKQVKTVHDRMVLRKNLV
jgi:hypothetical protein